MEEVIRQAKQAEEAGIKEIVLTGVQIGSWGKDLPENGLRIAALVSALLEETSLPRIRISSIEPWDVDEALLYCFRNPRLCPHLHIPLQSGSESILRRMARPFSAANFRALMQKIHLKRPEIAVTTDILCVFRERRMTYFSSPWLLFAKWILRAGMFSSSLHAGNCRGAQWTGRCRKVSVRRRSENRTRCVASKTGWQAAIKSGYSCGSPMGAQPKPCISRFHPGLFPRSDKMEPKPCQYHHHGCNYRNLSGRRPDC